MLVDGVTVSQLVASTLTSVGGNSKISKVERKPGLEPSYMVTLSILFPLFEIPLLVTYNLLV